MLISVAEAPDFHWTRVFGAGLITAGAVGVGLYLGLRNPGHYAAVRQRLSEIKTPLALLIFVLLFLPVAAALVGGLVGMISGAEGNAAPLALGIAFLLFMTAATATGAWVTAQAILWAEQGKEIGGGADATEGKGSEAP